MSETTRWGKIGNYRADVCGKTDGPHAPWARYPAKVTASFAELEGVHLWLDELFVQHQIALLGADIPTAIARLDDYERQLLTHIEDEDTRLIPVYSARTSDVPGGGRDFFEGEHIKLQTILGECREQLMAARGAAGDALSRRLVALFDREAFYKSLVQHHHAREQNILFPWLDRVTTDDERASLLASCKSLTAARAARG